MSLRQRAPVPRDFDVPEDKPIPPSLLAHTPPPSPHARESLKRRNPRSLPSFYWNDLSSSRTGNFPSICRMPSPPLPSPSFTESLLPPPKVTPTLLFTLVPATVVGLPLPGPDPSPRDPSVAIRPFPSDAPRAFLCGLIALKIFLHYRAALFSLREFGLFLPFNSLCGLVMAFPGRTPPPR